jgi:hypothetical protein
LREAHFTLAMPVNGALQCSSWRCHALDGSRYPIASITLSLNAARWRAATGSACPTPIDGGLARVNAGNGACR